MRNTINAALIAAAGSLALAGNANASKVHGPLDFVAGGATEGSSVRFSSTGTGFEAPQYALGPIQGQNGWTGSTTGGNPAVTANVSSANPASGQQHLRILDNAAVTNGTFTYAFSPTFQAANFLSVDVFISNLGGSDYRIQPQAPSQGFLTTAVILNFEGDIFVIDQTATGLAFVDTGANWTPGAYQNVSIQLNNSANTITYGLNGTPFYTGALFAGTQIEQVLLGSDNFALAGEFGDFDNVVIPEPASFAVLGVAGLGLLRRRRA